MIMIIIIMIIIIIIIIIITVIGVYYVCASCVWFHGFVNVLFSFATNQPLLLVTNGSTTYDQIKRR